MDTMDVAIAYSKERARSNSGCGEIAEGYLKQALDFLVGKMPGTHHKRRMPCDRSCLTSS